jgi:hypothetical protein
VSIVETACEEGTAEGRSRHSCCRAGWWRRARSRSPDRPRPSPRSRVLRLRASRRGGTGPRRTSRPPRRSPRTCRALAAMEGDTERIESASSVSCPATAAGRWRVSRRGGRSRVPDTRCCDPPPRALPEGVALSAGAGAAIPNVGRSSPRLTLIANDLPPIYVPRVARPRQPTEEPDPSPRRGTAERVSGSCRSVTEMVDELRIGDTRSRAAVVGSAGRGGSSSWRPWARQQLRARRAMGHRGSSRMAARTLVKVISMA